ncbi:hypothetical protein HPB51_029240 [Rhipicephalus microplus]|uniref:Tick transposon n=1 Tax=Rhipicephalus microplus TaxID=6941 RepID=A0A9J6CUU2_RHIMP|nr:hypothetical protein HPB51_029240 [Rhipicephalus microplus]
MDQRLASVAKTIHSAGVVFMPGSCTSCGVQVPAATSDGPTEHQCIPSCLFCGGCHKTGAPGCAGRFRQPVKSGSPRGSKPGTTGGGGGVHKQAPTPKTGTKKAPATKSNKPEPKKTYTGHSTNVKSGTPSEPPVLVKDFPPLTPVQAQVSCWGGAVSGPSPSPSPTETALQQQIGELRRQNQILARKIQELESKQVGSSKPVQEAEAEDGDDGSSVTSRLTSVSRQDADTVVGPASITGSIGRIESLERKTEQLETSVAALPTQIMSAVRESFQDMFTAALTQALPEILAQVSNSVLRAVQPWVITEIKNTTQSDSPQVKRKPASRQAAEEGFSGKCQPRYQIPHVVRRRVGPEGPRPSGEVSIRQCRLLPRAQRLSSAGPVRTTGSWRTIQITREIQNQKKLKESFHVQAAYRMAFEIRGPLHVHDVVSIQGWHQTTSQLQCLFRIRSLDLARERLTHRSPDQTPRSGQTIDIRACTGTPTVRGCLRLRRPEQGQSKPNMGQQALSRRQKVRSGGRGSDWLDYELHTVRTANPQVAEQVAIALALQNDQCEDVYSDSKAAVRAFQKGSISTQAARLLSSSTSDTIFPHTIH